MSTKHPRRKNNLNEQFSIRLTAMLESPAYRAMSVSAHRIMSRIEIELSAHGGNDNGKLPVTYQDFIAYGVHTEAVAPALREAEALGFIEITKHGSGGNAEHREPNLYRLTFAHARDSRQHPPSQRMAAHQIHRGGKHNSGHSPRKEKPSGVFFFPFVRVFFGDAGDVLGLRVTAFAS